VRPALSRLLRLVILAAVVAALGAVYLRLVRPWHVRWGATDEEVSAALPGDDVWPAPRRVETRAITVRAPADEVWRWVRQLGQDRGGFYSYEVLENLAGARMRSADSVLTGLAEREPGEKLWLAPADRYGGAGYVEIARVDPGRALVALTHGATPAPNGSWAWYVVPVGADTTRLLVRGRADGVGPPLFDLLVFEPVHFIMERGMLLGLAARAEGRRPLDAVFTAEALSWLAAFAVVLFAALAALLATRARRPLLLFGVAAAALLVLPLLRPPLPLTLLVAALLAAGVPWSLRRAGA
jgi:hypothetical protein